ncbi:MAG: hypothetical protein ACM3N0_00325 [Chloroflexota bacterium]
MSVNPSKPETFLRDQAISWLRERLPRGWSVEGSDVSTGDDGSPPADSTISLEAHGGIRATIAVEEKGSLSPRGAIGLLPPLARAARKLAGNVPLLVVAPWLSERTRELLAEQEINYIDLTGNALIRLNNPAFYLETTGASRNPTPKERGRAQLRGAKAARLSRLLVDACPPYGVRELAETADLAPGYVSRLLDTLYREALIERSPRGPVENVDIGGLLRRWASSYDVFKTNATTMFVAPEGIDHLLRRLADDPGAGARIAITGSFAANRIAPVTSPALLTAYCDPPALIANDFGLLPAEEGANVAVLQPFDRVVWLRTSKEDGLRYAAPSQVAVDCLSGDGRMPAEGEALLEWMQANESEWRAGSLGALRP